MIAILFFFNDTATTEIYTLSLHDALPIFNALEDAICRIQPHRCPSPRNERILRTTSRNVSCSTSSASRSEEHTSELQSPCNLVCRLLLEKKKTRTAAGLIVAAVYYTSLTA